MAAVVAYAASAGAWLLFVDTFVGPELLAGAAAALIASAAVLVALRGEVHWPSVLRSAASLPALVLAGLRDSVLVLAAMLLDALRVRRLTPAVRSEPATVGDHRRRAATRRGLRLLGTSFAPAKLAIGHDSTARSMLVHELIRPGGHARNAARPPRRRSRRAPSR